MYCCIGLYISSPTYLSTVEQEHTGHGQLHQHQDEQQDEKLQNSANQIQTSVSLYYSCSGNTSETA